jgi:hypothetical protein
VTEPQARSIMLALAAAFPSARLEQPTLDLWTNELQRLSSTRAATEATQDVIRQERFFPSLATYLEAYQRRTQLHAQEAESERRRQAEERGLPEGERPPLPVDVLKFIAERNLDDPKPLADAPHGTCDDCAHEGRRFQFKSLALCVNCAASRLRVERSLEAA